MIDLEDVSKAYANGAVITEVLHNVSLQIPQGELVAVVGASGSGKTTLMNILGCLDRPTAGRYLLSGSDVSSKTDREISRIRNKNVGFVFQTFHLIPRLTVLDNVLIPLLYTDRYPADAKERADRLIALVGLSHRRSYRPSQLSGGQQQRVAIARALINEPRIVLADEPTGNLDSEAGKSILELFRELNSAGITIVLVTHSPVTAAIAQRVITIGDGRIVSDQRSAS